jgi:hypothetical protein
LLPLLELSGAASMLRSLWLLSLLMLLPPELLLYSAGTSCAASDLHRHMHTYRSTIQQDAGVLKQM